MIAAPPIRRRLVGAALRWYRENLGYALDEAARILDCDRSKISRIETGERGIRGKELRELLTEYGADEDARAALAAIADPRHWRGWWREYAEAMPGGYQDYVSLEMSASHIMVYEAQRMPELFQIQPYTRELAGADPALTDIGLQEKAAEAVQARQRAVLTDGKANVAAIIGEAALRQVVGGTAVMTAQLEVLAAASSHGVVQVLPFSCGPHAAAGIGSMSILRFSGSSGLGVVHLAGAAGGLCLEGRDDLGWYTRVFEQLRAFALSPAESARLIRQCLRLRR